MSSKAQKDHSSRTVSAVNKIRAFPRSSGEWTSRLQDLGNAMSSLHSPQKRRREPGDKHKTPTLSFPRSQRPLWCIYIKANDELEEISTCAPRPHHQLPAWWCPPTVKGDKILLGKPWGHSGLRPPQLSNKQIPPGCGGLWHLQRWGWKKIQRNENISENSSSPTQIGLVGPKCLEIIF